MLFNSIKIEDIFVNMKQKKRFKLAKGKPTCSADRSEPFQCVCPWPCDSGTRSWFAFRSDAAFRPARSDDSWRCTRSDGTPPPGEASALCWKWSSGGVVFPPCVACEPLKVKYIDILTINTYIISSWNQLISYVNPAPFSVYNNDIRRIASFFHSPPTFVYVQHNGDVRAKLILH